MPKGKVATLTFFNRLNFGAELQAYALQRKISSLGYTCEILDVLSPDDPQARQPVRYSARKAAHRMHSSQTKLNNYLYKKMERLFGYKNERLTRRGFQKFKEQHLVVSQQKFACVDDLYSIDLDYDTFVTGSDQVWNPQTRITSPEPYFLTFAPPASKRFSYAASFGITMLPEDMREDYRRWLANIQNISVRENEGVAIVRDLTGRQAQVVLDPTLLITPDGWREVARPYAEGRYVVIYSRVYSKYIYDVAVRVAKSLGARIIRIPRGHIREGLEFGVSYAFGNGPAEFLGLFQGAAFIISSSFHGTAFAVNFRKPFYTILRKGGAVNSRMTSFLCNIGLSHRILYEQDELRQIVPHVDFAQTDMVLSRERAASTAFLQQSLAG